MKLHTYRTVLFLLAGLVVACTTPKEKKLSANAENEKFCPDWSSSSVSNYSNDDFSNQGCAFHNNLYVQLKDKEDYQHGAGKSAITGVHDSAILQNYMNGITSSAASSGGVSASSASSR